MFAFHFALLIRLCLFHFRSKWITYLIYIFTLCSIVPCRLCMLSWMFCDTELLTPCNVYVLEVRMVFDHQVNHTFCALTKGLLEKVPLPNARRRNVLTWNYFWILCIMIVMWQSVLCAIFVFHNCFMYGMIVCLCVLWCYIVVVYLFKVCFGSSWLVICTVTVFIQMKIYISKKKSYFW